jgi:hypothetical protein
MDQINKAIALAMEEFRKENGEDAKLEDGEEFAAVFNDGILIIGIEDHELKIKFILGEPYKIDFDLGMTERIGEEE